MPRLGGRCHRLLGVSCATHLASSLGGWIWHGSQRTRFDLSGNLGRFLRNYLFKHFFREFIPKKVAFEFLNQFSRHILHAMILWILDSKPWGFGFKARGLQRNVSSVTYFSNLLEDKDRRLKTKLTFSLILRVHLRLWGYSIWSASSIAPHIKEDLTTTRGMSTLQPRCSQGSTRKTHLRWSSGELEDTFRGTRKPVVLDYEELGGLSDPGLRDCAYGLHLTG
jgi:hypothetical protein